MSRQWKSRPGPPRYSGFKSASDAASSRASGSSRKTGTKPELLLRRALRATGLKFRSNATELPGRPDIVLDRSSLAIFVDGDFWHGRRWRTRKAKLAVGHNAEYWVAKIEANISRDRTQARLLRDAGWVVLRFWESEIRAQPEGVVGAILSRVGAQWSERYAGPGVDSPSVPSNRHYVRAGNTNQTLKGAALDRFLLRKQGRHWDGVPVPNASLKSLSRQAIDAFRKSAGQSKRLDAAVLREPIPALIDKLHLRDGRYLKRAAVLLFDPDPERFVTGAFVKIGFFRTNADLLYDDEIHGDLFSQVSKTLDLLSTKYLRAGISYQGIQRVETLPVPEAALREAVLNAVIHKDYASGTSIQISVYDDKLLIWNPGELPADWDIEKLLGKHASRPFNPDIANAFFRAGEIEAGGRGIERIITACKEARTPRPVLKYETAGFWIELPYGVGAVRSGGKARVETRVETRVKTPALVLELLQQNPSMSPADVASSIGKATSTIERAASKLAQEGRLRYVGPKKGGRWEVLR